jgi:hypothetical protein
VLIPLQVTFSFKLGLGLGHCFLIKNLSSDRPRVGKTLVCAFNGESVKIRWVGKSFTDATYNASRSGSVKIFTDRRRVGKAAFTDPPSVANNERRCSES